MRDVQTDVMNLKSHINGEPRSLPPLRPRSGGVAPPLWRPDLESLGTRAWSGVLALGSFQLYSTSEAARLRAIIAVAWGPVMSGETEQGSTTASTRRCRGYGV